MHLAPEDRAIFAIQRPDPKLWTYYLLTAAAFPPLFPVLVLPLYFRYHTMRYTFTEEGISMSWGVLFRKEIIIHYARIQDIHLRSNVVERWLGLAKVLVQTASGNAAAELTLEGLPEFEKVRDFLYARMRGVKDVGPAHGSSSQPAHPTQLSQSDAELATLLQQTAEEVRAISRSLRETRLSVEKDRSDV